MRASPDVLAGVAPHTTATRGPLGHRGVQRGLVLAVLLAVVAALLLTPRPGRDDAVAAAQPCGAGDAHRATLTTGQGVTLRPCLSKVNLRLEIPRTQTSNVGCGLFFLQACFADGKWSITGVKRSGAQTVTFADGTTESLYRLTFQQFSIIKDGTLTTTNGTGYTLKILPDSAATLGGAVSGTTIYTDLWVTGASMIYLNFLTFNCTSGARVDNGLLALSNIITISDTGCGMTLDIRYAVTTSVAANGDINGVYSVALPNTTIEVS